MITTLLAAVGLIRSTVKPSDKHVRRARWRGSDGQWQWAAV